jgi:hypothetical protein
MNRPGLAMVAVGCLLLAGCGGSQHSTGSHPTPSSSERTTTSPSPSPSRSATQSPATSSPQPVPALPVGGPVPVGFEPQSVSFVSAEVGYVLGTTASCASAPCTSLVRTSDGGRHWVGVPAPRAALNGESSGGDQAATSVSSVRFADALDGYVFGPALWVTHDGARSWHQVNPGGSVIGLATAGGKTDALVQITDVSQVVSTPVTREAFSTVTPRLPLRASGHITQTFADAVVLHPPVGFALLGATGQYPNGQAVIYAENASGRWASFPDPCYRQRNGLGLTSFAAPDAINLFTLCTGNPAASNTQKEVVLTRDGLGTALGAPPTGGDGGQIAAASSTTLVVASRSAASWLYRSTNGGRTWSTAVMFSDGGAGLSDLRFITATQGVVIHGHPAPAGTAGNVATPDQLLMTRDGGATWQSVSI